MTINEPASRAWPTCAVLMSVYDREQAAHFESAVKSMLAQDYCGRIRIYLGVDGPVPEALDNIIDGLRPSLHSVCRFPANRGLAAVLNDLITSLDDETYVLRMDSDDWAYPNRVSRQIAFLEDNPGIDVLGCSIAEVDELTHTVRIVRYPTNPEQARASIAFRTPVPHPAVCMRRSALEIVGRYPDVPLNEDIALWFTLMEQGATFTNLDEPLLRMRLAQDFYARRGYRKAVGEFQVYVHGIWRLDGLSWRLAFPVARLLFRVMPRFLVRWGYAVRARRH